MNKDEIWIYDIEVFKDDWIVIFHHIGSNERVVFVNEAHNVREFLLDFRPVLGGYNVKNYDQHVLRCIYNLAPANIVKACNDWIIGGNQGWEFVWLKNKDYLPGYTFDLMDDIPVPLRLKEIEANIGMSIQESSVPFDIDRSLTEAELEQTIHYCHHDIDATVKLFDLRKNYLEAKIAVGELKGLDWRYAIGLTNAKLTAKYLDAKSVDRSDEFEYEFPENLKVNNQTVLAFFEKIDYDEKLETTIAGCPHVVAWGGLHGALECYEESSTDEREISSYDVASYYPSLMIVNGYMSRNVPNPGQYEQIYHDRLAAKKAKDKKKANALKLVLNTTYGAMKNKYNDLFDPRMANAVCISGQLYLIDLIEKLEASINKLTLIQSNTDGIIVSYPKSEIVQVAQVVADWEQRTGFAMEKTLIYRIVQKDVNNYVLFQNDNDEPVKVKGGYVSNFSGGDWQNASLPIVAKAIVEALLNDIPPEVTITAVKGWSPFQMVAKTGRTYDKTIYRFGDEDIEVQSTNRIFATTNEVCGTLYKVKTEDKRRDKIANAPEHAYIDNSANPAPGHIDYQWYIDLAQKRINDYRGVIENKAPKTRKEKVKKMPATKTTKATGITQKLFELRRIMAGYKWEKDGKNRHQGYTYITEAQYKQKFNEALLEAGLDFRFEADSYEFIHSISDKMHMVIATYNARIVDPETSDEVVFKCFGSGADNGDKAIYKAETGAIKFFLASNFLVSENNDPEGDEVETIAEKPKYVTPEAKEQIKKAVTNQSAPATKEQIEILLEGAAQLRELGLTEEADDYEALAGTGLTKAEVEKCIEQIGEVLAA